MPTDAVVLSLKSLKLFGMAGAVAELARLRRFDPISSYFRRIHCANPLFVLAPDSQNRL